MKITRGRISKPQKIVVYGPEGVGKSTFASQFPNALFIDTEDSTVTMDVARLPKPTSWTMLMSQIEYVKSNPDICKTLVIDTADWTERLCAEHICATGKVSGIEDFGYGKGYVYLEEEFGRFLNKLQDIIEVGINIVITAHAEVKKIEQPEEIGGFDHWQLKLEKKTMPLLKEWSDILLFANYKVYVVNIDNQGAAKGKNKAQGGKRIMYTTHTPWWDAKNRHGLPDELPFEYKEISHCIVTNRGPKTEIEKSASIPADLPKELSKSEPKTEIIKSETSKKEIAKAETKVETETVMTVFSKLKDNLDNIPKALADLMLAKNVTVDEIQRAVARRGYYPEDTPIENYDPDFVAGVLVAAWPQVFNMIQREREEIEELRKAGIRDNPF